MLSFPADVSAPMGFGPAAFAAFGGHLSDETAEYWGKKKDVIYMGFGELKEQLLMGEKV